MKKRFANIMAVGALLVGSIAFSKPLFEKFVNTDTLMHRIGCRLFEFNTISVETDLDIDAAEILIKRGNRTVFKQGEQKNRVGQEYGHHIFKIYYQGLLIAEAGHFKRNNWYTNQYMFGLSKQGSQILLDYEIEGPDSQNDSFQKRYVYSKGQDRFRIEYVNRQGQVYHTEWKAGDRDTL